ncbi:uncharacterized protein LOC112346362 isoform X1 [Selaginella moellendorffii]|uniref:uncharacterized protein LOC112346362 isoform X1 n=1 Tax=Selaginella moellendorffii TaxID=88036 RepID=UPI000D1C4396|nr:uncharacterized protein LOC112346362 isoform X1 [Selaginella moellendorffii]|eukprot:XP_024530929.1 uncharacterized protein LOC112346362 isoform X1 [Selaginella moellendorffii]
MALPGLIRPKRSSLILSLRSSYAALLSTLSAAAKDQIVPLIDVERDPAFGTVRPVEAAPLPLPVAIDGDDEDATDDEDSAANPKWKKLTGAECGIYHGNIPQSAWSVLQRLKDRGYGVYLVGGCVRDSLLKQAPKDYDIITTANLDEVKKSFSRSMIVGRHFPVCHVTCFGHTIEVSSFHTVSSVGRRKPRNIMKDFFSKEDLFRCENTMSRDFTINGFMYDPFERTLFDYVGGLPDLEKKKVRTIIPPDESFAEDPARLLRGVRIAARLGFRFSRDTSQAVKAFKSSLMAVNQARLMQELNTMMAYGAAAASIRLLWKYDYLDVMLPVQASYFARCKLKRSSKPRKNLLTDLLTILDKFSTPDKPCHTTLWVALLAFHLALDEKRSHLGATAALLAIRHQNMNYALKDLARFEEKLRQGEMTINEAYMERSIGVDDNNTIVAEALHIIEDAVSGLQKMHGNPENEPSTYGTLISRTMYAKVLKLFHGARDRVRVESLYAKRATSDHMRKRGFVEGVDAEVVHALSCICLNTLYLPAKGNVFLFN